MLDPEEFYRSKINEYAERMKRLKKKSAYVSVARLAVFLFIAFAVYRLFGHYNLLGVFAVFILLILFVALIRYSASLTESRMLTSRLLFINENEAGVWKGARNKFHNGSDVQHAKMHAGDLDIFGERSVFHVLNRTVTKHGCEALVHLLNHSLLNKNDVSDHQQAVKQLALQPDTRQLITAYGLLNQEDKAGAEEILKWMDTPEKVSVSKWINILRFAVPLLCVVGILIYLNSNNPVLFGITFIINFIIIGSFARYTSQQHMLIGKKDQVLQQYGTILKTFSTVDPGSSSILERLKNTSAGATKEILRLSKLSSYFDQRLNLLIAFLGNGILLYDIHVVIALEQWKKRNRKAFAHWMQTVGEIEKFNSLGTFSFNKPGYVFPEVKEGKPFIQAKELGHMLIGGDSQVTNDITAGESENLLLITGSNMSGKSTFLRTVGVNVLLAQCGLPVCAKEFSFSPMQILSSIRVSDSLQENTSYFMAELKRLKEIIDLLSGNAASLVLNDEVLRGTNSEDKTFGSEELIKKLSLYNCLAFFASHDLSLGALENTLPGKVKNYCFESTITNDELIFDYKLRRGIATNKNASFLMKKMGIIN